MFAEYAGFIGATALTFFPPRYRPYKGLQAPAIASAFLEGLLAVGVMLSRIYGFIPRAGLVSDKLADQLFVKYGGEFMAANAVGGAANFWLDPIVLVSLFFFLESVFRGFAALEGSSIVGTLPLYSISLVHGLLDKASHKLYLGKLVADRIVPGSEKLGYAIQVQSCRPKLDWNRHVTVEFRGEFFECFKEEQGPPPRRFIYYLRRSPASRLVVVIQKYRPNDVMRRA